MELMAPPLLTLTLPLLLPLPPLLLPLVGDDTDASLSSAEILISPVLRRSD